MNKLIIAIFFISLLCCNESQPKELNFYGEKITSNNISDFVKVKNLTENQAEVETKIEGTILSTCPKKGCWMTLPAGNLDETIMVRFKDYGFFMPLDAAGKEVIVAGKAFVNEVSVADLKHYAEDAGKSPEEIANISEPVMEFAFEANGVLLKK